MVPGLVITKILQKIIPKVLDMIMKQFPGIEKINYLVKYMEEDNEADLAIKQLASEIDNLKDVIASLKKKVKELKNGK